LPVRQQDLGAVFSYSVVSVAQARYKLKPGESIPSLTSFAQSLTRRTSQTLTGLLNPGESMILRREQIREGRESSSTPGFEPLEVAARERSEQRERAPRTVFLW